MDDYIFICMPVLVFLSIQVGTINYSKGRLEVNRYAQCIVGSLGVGNYVLYSCYYENLMNPGLVVLSCSLILIMLNRNLKKFGESKA